jgi:UDP-N-acetylglucosamine enolpyruvyl transferase
LEDNLSFSSLIQVFVMLQTTNLKINSGYPMSGIIYPTASKNGALQAIAAALLSDETSKLNGIFHITHDIQIFMDIINGLGGKCEHHNSTLAISARDIDFSSKIPISAAEIPGAQLLVGVFLARIGRCELPYPEGGCNLGFRWVEGLVDYMRASGVTVTETSTGILFEVKNNPSVIDIFKDQETQNIFLRAPRVVPTGSLIMSLSRNEGKSCHITGAANEPHIQLLHQLLQQMGAQIQYDSSGFLITGKKTLKGFNIIIPPDEIYFLRSAFTVGITKGIATFKDVANYRHIRYVAETCLKAFNVDFRYEGEDIIIDGKNSELKINALSFHRYKKDFYKIAPSTWPGWPVDSLPAIIIAAMFSKKDLSAYVINHMYDDALKYIKCLSEIGVGIELKSNETAIIDIAMTLPKEKNIIIECPKVIEGVAALLMFALGLPKGYTVTLLGAEYLFRRSPNLVEEFKALGLVIEIVD